MTRSANHDVRRAGAAAERLADTVAGAVRDMPEHLKHLNEQLGKRAGQGLDAVGSAANDAIRQGRDSLDRIEGAIEHRVRSQPWQAMFLAVGIGAALALLLRPRR